jgi:predicted tellurium resistance membrane protein TerC
MQELLTDPAAWASFVTLTMLEIVLGIDNIIFLSILVGRLPPAQQQAGRIAGLSLAMLTRIGLLYSITWLITLTAPMFRAFGQDVSGRDLVLGAGGLFLLWKSVVEIHASVEGPLRPQRRRVPALGRLPAVIVQIAVVDIVFSIDSVFTAVGLAQRFEIMAAAIVLAVLVMMLVSRGVSEFIGRHPTVRVLALAFLILIGVALIADALEFHIPKGYLYFAMAFALLVEMVNSRARRNAGRSAPPGESG